MAWTDRSVAPRSSPRAKHTPPSRGAPGDGLTDILSRWPLRYRARGGGAATGHGAGTAARVEKPICRSGPGGVALNHPRMISTASDGSVRLTRSEGPPRRAPRPGSRCPVTRRGGRRPRVTHGPAPARAGRRAGAAACMAVLQTSQGASTLRPGRRTVAVPVGGAPDLWRSAQSGRCTAQQINLRGESGGRAVCTGREGGDGCICEGCDGGDALVWEGRQGTGRIRQHCEGGGAAVGTYRQESGAHICAGGEAGSGRMQRSDV